VRLDQMSLDTYGEFQLGEGCQQCRWLALAVGTLGEALPHGGDDRSRSSRSSNGKLRGVDPDRLIVALVLSLMRRRPWSADGTAAALRSGDRRKGDDDFGHCPG
jgi:hypothetical protein